MPRTLVDIFAARLTCRPAVEIAPQMLRAGLTLSQALRALRIATKIAR